MIGTRLRVAAAGVVGGLSLLAASAAMAQDLQIQVTAVRASESGPSDPELVSLRPRLRRLVGYRSYQIVQEEHRRCSWRSPETFQLPNGRSLHLLPKGMEGESVMMQVRLLDGRRRLVDTNIRLTNRGTMLFGVGRDARAGDSALIILLTAEKS